MNIQSTIKAVVAGDARANEFFRTAIGAQRMANWALRNASEEEAYNHNAHYQEDMRYVTRRVCRITGMSFATAREALIAIAEDEMRRLGPLTLRRA